MGNRQAGPPQMVAPTYSQVAQGPPRQALLHGAEETRRWQEIMHGKRAAEAPPAAGAPHATSRA